MSLLSAAGAFSLVDAEVLVELLTDVGVEDPVSLSVVVDAAKNYEACSFFINQSQYLHSYIRELVFRQE